jgi:hypothetical protein
MQKKSACSIFQHFNRIVRAGGSIAFSLNFSPLFLCSSKEIGSPKAYYKNYIHMKKKILKISLISIASILILAIALPFIFKDKIKAMLNEEINNSVNAKISFGGFSLSMFKSFPDFTFTLNGLKVAGINEFSQDTLANIGTLSVTVDLMSVFKSEQLKMQSFLIDDARIHARVLKNGKANWDIMKPEEEKAKPGEPAKFSMALKKYAITDALIVYEDESMGFATRMQGFEHKGTGDFTQDLFTLSTITKSDSMTVSYGGITYLKKVNARVDADLDMDMKNFKFTFKDNRFFLNDLVFGLNGWYAMPGDDMDMDLSFSAEKNDFKSFLSLIPSMFTKDFEQVKSSGKLAFKGFLKGRMNDKQMPAFGLDLIIENGMFRYPALPEAVNNVQVKLAVSNPDGVPDHTVINLSRMHVELGAEPFDATLLMKTPISDPDIDATLKGKVDLAGAGKFIPLEKGTSLKGIVQADVAMKGRMSAIEKKQYEDFNAEGQISVTQLDYKTADPSGSAQVERMQLLFNPKNVTMPFCDALFAGSDIHLKGSLDNFIAWFVKGDKLKGSLDISSSSINLNTIMVGSTSTAATPADTAPMQVLKVPENIEFDLNADIGKVIYTNLELMNVKGNLQIANGAVNMKDIRMRMLEGTLGMKGSYNSTDSRSPSVDFAIDIEGFDIPKTFTAFNTVQKLAPIAGRCTGKFSTSFSFTGKLDQHMNPVMNSLNGKGNLKTQQIVVSNFEPLSKLADKLKMEQLKKMEVGDVNLTFKFSDGRVYVDPFKLKTGKIVSTVSGSNGLDQSISYVMAMEIPRDMMGGKANSAIEGLFAKAAGKGVDISLPEKINVDALIEGTVTKPEVSLSLKGAKTDDLKAKAMEELEKKKKEAEEKIRAEAEKLKKEAEDRVNAEKEKLRQEGERLKKEAEDKINAEKERLKQEAEKKKKEAEEKIKKEATDKLKNLFK